MGRRCTEGPSQSWRRPLLVPAVNRSRVSASWAHASGVATLADLVDATLIGRLQGPVLGQVNARISDAANSMAHVPYVHLPMSQAKQSVRLQMRSGAARTNTHGAAAPTGSTAKARMECVCQQCAGRGVQLCTKRLTIVCRTNQQATYQLANHSVTARAAGRDIQKLVCVRLLDVNDNHCQPACVSLGVERSGVGAPKAVC